MDGRLPLGGALNRRVPARRALGYHAIRIRGGRETMIEIEFVLRGASVRVEEVEDPRERAILAQIERSIVDRVGATRCAVHGEFPRLVATGPRADDLQFELAGCCQDLLTKTAAALS